MKQDPLAEPDGAVNHVLGVLRGTSIAEIEIEWDGGRIHIEREPSSIVETIALEPVAEEADTTEVVVTSSYVGRFVRDPSLNLPEAGDAVAEGDVLAQVETLSMFNRVLTPAAGVIRQILVEDGDPVEYGQRLVIIDRHLPE